MWLNHEFCAMVACLFNFPISSPCPLKRNKGVGCGSFYCGCNPCNIPYFFFWCFSTLCLTPSTLNVLSRGPLLSKNVFFHVQLNTFKVSSVPFLTPLYCLISFCSSFFNIPIYLFFPIFCHPWCHLGVFLLLIKLGSFPNQNNTLIWILTKDVQYWECLLGKHLILGCPLRTVA